MKTWRQRNEGVVFFILALILIPPTVTVPDPLFYRICNRILASTTPFSELEPTQEAPAHLVFDLLPAASPPIREPVEWFHAWRFADDDAEDWLKMAQTPDGYLLRFPAHAEFQVSASGSQIRCRPWPETPPETLRHLLLDQVLPLAFTLAGDFVLHASAVQMDQQVIGILGRSGRGKSTLAASFATQGWPLLTDDCLVLREDSKRWRALPYYAGVRLWPDNVSGLFTDAAVGVEVAHYTRKQRVSGTPLAAFSSEALPLHQLFFLGDPQRAGSAVVITPLTPRAAFMALVENHFVLEIQKPAALKRQFEAIGRLTETVACFTLNYPREYAVLPNVRAALLARVAQPV